MHYEGQIGGCEDMGEGRYDDGDVIVGDHLGTVVGARGDAVLAVIPDDLAGSALYGGFEDADIPAQGTRAGTMP